MTCADARHRILSADASILRGETDRVLRAHLDGCRACSADASRVLGETARLGAALAARARQPRIRRAGRRNVFAFVPIGVAAATILVVVTHRIAPDPITPTPVVAKPAPAVNTKPRRAASRADLPIRTSRTAANGRVGQARPEVGVTVGDDQRAAIIATSNPNITVIWLSRGQQP
jgi:hypothetical protein